MSDSATFPRRHSVGQQRGRSVRRTTKRSRNAPGCSGSDSGPDGCGGIQASGFGSGRCCGHGQSNLNRGLDFHRSVPGTSVSTVLTQATAKSGRIVAIRNAIVIKSLLGMLFAALVFVQVPQWDNDWTKCSVSVPDTACHWYVVNPDNTFGKGFSWITAPEFDVAALNDIGAQHEVTIAKGYQTTVELMNADSNVKYGDDY